MFQIANKTYEVIKDHKDGWNLEAFRERYSEVLERYDFVVGDWGYSQLRLRGFFKDSNPKATKDTVISTLQDYLNEYCNFGCAYFIVEKIQNKPFPGNQDKEGHEEDSQLQEQEQTDEEPLVPVHEQQRGSLQGPVQQIEEAREDKVMTAAPEAKVRHAGSPPGRRFQGKHPKDSSPSKAQSQHSSGQKSHAYRQGSSGEGQGQQAHPQQRQSPKHKKNHHNQHHASSKPRQEFPSGAEA